MTSQLSWHVQNLVVITVLESGWEKRYFYWKFISKMDPEATLGGASGHELPHPETSRLGDHGTLVLFHNTSQIIQILWQSTLSYNS